MGISHYVDHSSEAKVAANIATVNEQWHYLIATIIIFPIRCTRALGVDKVFGI